MVMCTSPGMGMTKVGDKWTIEAAYNLTQHAPMMQDGEPEDVMGYAMVYLAESPSCVPN